MPFREQPLDPVFQPPSYREPDYTQDVEVTPLQTGGFIVRQEPDRLAVHSNRVAFMDARALASAEVPPVVAHDILRHRHAVPDATRTVDGSDAVAMIRTAIL